MRRGRTAGFTLIELLLALALTAIVATGALATLNTFADADRSATQRLEETVGVGRALQTLRQEVSDATALNVTASRFVLTRRDGTAVGYAITTGATELQRFDRADTATATSAADAAVAAATVAPTYSGRGHLKDSDYRAAAILQGVKQITATAVVRSGTTLGVNVLVQCNDGRSNQCLAMSVPLLEIASKYPALPGGGK